MLKILNVVILTLMCIAQMAIAEIYQCKDAQGRIAYKDTKCRSGKNETQKVIALPKLNIDHGGENSNVSKPRTNTGRLLGVGNLLKNGDFTHEHKQWLLSDNAVISWSKNQGTYGTGALIMNAPKPPSDGYIHETQASQCVVLNGSEKYTLSAKLLLEKTPQRKSAHRANVLWFQSKDCSSGGTFATYIEPLASVGRQQMISQAIKPTLSAVAAKIELVQMGAISNQGKAIWDDITFTGVGSSQSVSPVWRPTVAGNYIKNGKFRQNLDNWRNSSGAAWSAFVDYKGGGSAETTLRSQKGSRGTGVLSQCVVLGQAQTLTLGAFVRINGYASSQKGGGRLRLSWYDQEDCKGKYQAGRKHADILDKEGWQHLMVKDLVVPPTAKAARVQLIQSISGKGVFTVNWDGVYLQENK